MAVLNLLLTHDHMGWKSTQDHMGWESTQDHMGWESTQDHMRMGISKHHPYGFHSVSAKRYEDIGYYGGIQAVTSLAIYQV